MEISITENKYGKCDADTLLIYPHVDSCLTLTALFGDGSRTGVHLTEVDSQGGDAWKEIFTLWKTKSLEKQAKEKHRGVRAVFVLGDLPWPEDAMGEIRAGVAELNSQVTEEARYGDISIDGEGTITGRTGS